jgi:N-acetylmuramoyl-L-alanine amidase
MKIIRNIKKIVVHCTATPITATLESIKNYWKTVRKWGDTPGYHYLIKRDGEVENLLSEDKVSYGAYGHNMESIHIAYIGGIDAAGNPADNRTISQLDSMYYLIAGLLLKYPKSEPCGHRDFPNVKKACPCFDVKSWFANYIPSLKDRA